MIGVRQVLRLMSCVVEIGDYHSVEPDLLGMDVVAQKVVPMGRFQGPFSIFCIRSDEMPCHVLQLGNGANTNKCAPPFTSSEERSLRDRNIWSIF